MISLISDRVPRQLKGWCRWNAKDRDYYTTIQSEKGFTADRCALVEIHFIVIQDDNFGR